jgi:hypothetical protein
MSLKKDSGALVTAGPEDLQSFKLYKDMSGLCNHLQKAKTVNLDYQI